MRIITLFILFSCILFAKNEIGKIPAPYNNDYVTLEVSPVDEIWAGTWGDGIKKSINKGVSYFNSSTGLTNLYINDINFKDDILLTGTQGGGVFKSIDKGNNWEQINNGLINLNVKGVVVKDDTTYFAATEGNGIFRTTDGGDSWEEKNIGNNFQDMNFIHLTPEGNLLASRNGDGLIRSDDNGETWKYSQSGIFNKYLTDIQNLPNGEIWISSAGDGIFQSSSDGNHWLRVDRLEGLVDLNIQTFTYFKHETEYFQIVGTRNWGIWRFQTQWNDQKFIQDNYFIYETAQKLRILSDGRIIVAAGKKGLAYSTNNGVNWTYDTSTREDDLTQYLLEAEGSNLYAAIARKGVFKSSDYGLTWENIGEVNNSYKRLKKYGNYLYVIAQNKIRFTSNEGATWNDLVPTDLEEDAPPMDKLYRFNDVYRKNNELYVAYNFAYTGDSPPPDGWNPPPRKNTLFYSSNNGTSWELLDIPDNNSEPMECIAMTSDNDIFVSTNSAIIWKSSDRGNSWAKTPKDLQNNGVNVKEIKPKGNTLFFVLDDSLMYTIDDCKTFEKIDYGIANLEEFLGRNLTNTINGVGIVNNNSYYLGLPYNFGIYKTVDNGETYDSINNSFPCEEIRSVSNNADGDVYFATTSIWRFINPSRLYPPSLVSPPDRTQNMSISANETGGRPAAVITWEEAEKANMYEIQVSEYEQFYNFMYKKVHSGTFATLTDSLKYNTTYYWRVRSKVNDSYSRWSSRWEFTTELPAPTLTYPDENEVGVPIQPVYTWENVEGAENYIVQVASNLDFQDIIFSETVTSSTFESGTYTSAEVLSPSTQYFWRMKSLSSKSESRWSEYNAFTTVTAPPTLIYPENNAREISPELTYKFKGVPNASSYRIQTSSDSTFEDNALRILDRNTETDSTHFFDFLQYYKEYYWRVQSILVVDDGQGNDIEYLGEWSETWKFTTGIKPPGLLSPPNNSFDVPLTTKLEWDEFDGAVGYHIQLGLVEDFTDENGLLVNDTIDELSYDMPADLLKNYELYYWRMRVILEDDLAAAWVEPWRFTTVMKQSEQVNPNCDAEDMPLEFTLVWEEVKGGDLYRVEVSKTQIFNEANIIFSEEEIDADRIKIENGLEPNNTYYWRVQGYNANNTGPWSEICSFSTETSSVRDFAKEFNFIAYPNPTSDKMNYEFTLQEASNVTIEIYDLTGVKLSTLCDKYLSNGVQNFSWDVSNISNGTYNLVMTVNGKSYMKLVGVSK